MKPQNLVTLLGKKETRKPLKLNKSNNEMRNGYVSFYEISYNLFGKAIRAFYLS